MMRRIGFLFVIVSLLFVSFVFADNISDAKKLCQEGLKVFYMGDIDKAIGMLRNAVQLDPDSKDAYSVMAEIYDKLNNDPNYAIAKDAYLRGSDIPIDWIKNMLQVNAIDAEENNGVKP